MVNVEGSGTPSGSTASMFVTPSSRRKGRVTVSQVPWVEKYRPRSVSEVIHQDEIVSLLKKITSGGSVNLPNLLFYGPPGTGKTSTILALAKELFGPEVYRDRVLELNASDERGIQVVREKIKNFSQTKISSSIQPSLFGSMSLSSSSGTMSSSSGTMSSSSGTTTSSSSAPPGACKERVSAKKKVPPLKIVILDEADSMTTAAQSALRRIMESCTETTRFCIICNYVSRIIEPISSRCSKFRFKPIREDLIRDKLLQVAQVEGITFQKISERSSLTSGDDGQDMEMDESNGDVLDQIISITDGDMRRSLTLLQTLYRLKSEPVEEESCEGRMDTDSSQTEVKELPQEPSQTGSKEPSQTGSKDQSGQGLKMTAHITLADVHNVSGHIPTEYVSRFCDSCQCYDHVQMEEIVDEILLQGYSGSQFLLQLINYVMAISVDEEEDEDSSKKESSKKESSKKESSKKDGGRDVSLPTYSLRNDQVADVLMKIAQADHALLTGASEYLQLLDVGRVFIKVLSYPEPKKRKRVRKGRYE